MANIEINDRVVCKIGKSEYSGRVVSHPVTVQYLLCRQIEFNECVGALEPASPGSPARARWDYYIPLVDMRLDSAALLRTQQAIRGAGLQFRTVPSPVVSAARVTADHEARGWVLVGRWNTSRGVASLTFCVADEGRPDT